MHRFVMYGSATLIWIGLLPVLAFAQSGTPTARPHNGSYAHALQIEARREAYWGHNAAAPDRSVTPETAQRQARYWQSQQRSRALCQAYAGCF